MESFLNLGLTAKLSKKGKEPMAKKPSDEAYAKSFHHEGRGKIRIAGGDILAFQVAEELALEYGDDWIIDIRDVPLQFVEYNVPFQDNQRQPQIGDGFYVPQVFKKTENTFDLHYTMASLQWKKHIDQRKKSNFDNDTVGIMSKANLGLAMPCVNAFMNKVTTGSTSSSWMELSVGLTTTFGVVSTLEGMILRKKAPVASSFMINAGTMLTTSVAIVCLTFDLPSVMVWAIEGVAMTIMGSFLFL